MSSVHEQLSEQFRRWELRGRGWQVFSEPVCPEPPFVPFHGHFLPNAPVVDDGRQPTFLSSLVQKLSRKLSTEPPAAPVEPEPEEEPEPTPLTRDSLVELQASLPGDLDISRESFEQFFQNLSLCREPVAFELLGSHKRVLAQFAVSPEDAPQVRQQLEAHFPDVMFLQREDTLGSAWDASEGDEAWAVEFGLEREFMLPLASGKLDPFIGIIGALAQLQPGELGLFQVLWQPVENPWSESIINSVTHSDGKPFFVNAPELAGAAENKIARPLYAAVVRILVRAATTSRLRAIARGLAGSLRVFANPQGNALIPLHNEDYGFEEHIKDVLGRQSRRAGMLLNSDELIGFVHLPSSAVRSPALQRDSGRTKAAPDIVRHSPGIVIGDNEHAGETVPVFLNPDQRVRHTHIIGSNGTGKSSLLLNLIRQDIENGDGVAVLDPHGDLIDQILSFIPAERIDDVVLVDLSDEAFPVGFNILQAHSETEKRLLASDLVAMFRRLSTSWGDQMDTVLQNAILAFLESSRGGTLADLRRFLRDETYRKEFLETVQDPEICDFWLGVFPKSGGAKSIGSLLARLQDFFSQKPIRNMVSQRDNKLDFADIMDSGKIFLAKLSEGLGGEENTYLIGTLLISKFQQLAMARQAQKIEARRDFWLYIDEFQHFITPSMAKILTGARKYRLGLTLAHQQLHQLQSDPKVASAVMTQPCTRIVLRVGDDDAKKLGDGFDSFDAKSLARLERFHAIARVEQNDFDFNLALRKPELPAEGGEIKAAVVAASRTKYARPRAEVEADLLAGMGGAVKKPEPPELPGPTASPPPSPPGPAAPPRAPTGKAQSVVPTKTDELEIAAIRKPTAPKQADAFPSTGSGMHDAPSSPPAAPPAVAVEISPLTTSLDAEVQNRNQAEAAGADETTQHESLKNQIRAEAESLDYTASPVEVIVPQHGRIDLVLTRGSRSIACEISVTTPPEKEADHIRLRLKAGFTHVAVISANRRKLVLIQEAYLKRNGSKNVSKVGFYTPKEFFAQLFDWATDDPEGGKLERGKPKKQPFDFNPTPEAIANRAAEERKSLDSLTKLMRTKRTG